MPASIETWMVPMTTQASAVKPMPAVMRRKAVGSIPMRRMAGNSTRLLNGIRIITSSGLSACICAGWNLNSLPKKENVGWVIELACTIQVDAFWSNSDQNGVTSANTMRMRSTARTPSTAASGWMARARSSCIEVPMPPNASSSTRAVQALMTKPHWNDIASDSTAPTAPRMATARPGRHWPGLRASRAVRATRMKESGSGGAGGTWTYLRLPIQKTMVAMNIRMPGMPKATDGP